MNKEIYAQLKILENSVELLRRLLDDDNLIAAHDYIYRAGAAAYNVNELLLKEINARSVHRRDSIICTETTRSDRARE